MRSYRLPTFSLRAEDNPFKFIGTGRHLDFLNLTALGFQFDSLRSAPDFMYQARVAIWPGGDTNLHITTIARTVLNGPGDEMIFFHHDEDFYRISVLSERDPSYLHDGGWEDNE